ncbi:MAG: LysR family transcriptional regulator [Lachnospiraceae bacterium]|jgi:DNA-binding transcriptional LysR family regulator|nr:LysR family transcriptional regulator [Lachnospiraceae bacterium]
MFENKEYIYAVYQEKSFSKAAAKLYISQPSLSLTVKKVEKRIGGLLFDRSTNPVRLTDCGREYIRCVERIMDVETGFENFLNDLNELKTGNLSIGASNFFASYILPPVIARFKSRYPKVDLELTEADTIHLERALYAGDLDMIVDNYRLSESIYDKYFYYSEQMILAVPESLSTQKGIQRYRLDTSAIIAGIHRREDTLAPPLSLFAGTPFIALRPGNDTRDRMEQIFAEQGITPRITLELDQLATAYHVACSGLGATLTSDTLVRETTPAQKMCYYKLASTHAARSNFFYYKKTKYLTRAMREFLSMVAA